MYRTFFFQGERKEKKLASRESLSEKYFMTDLNFDYFLSSFQRSVFLDKEQQPHELARKTGYGQILETRTERKLFYLIFTWDMFFLK